MTFADLADAEFVQLSTYRRSGAAVPTPVWAASLPGGDLVVTTMATTGKVKRIRSDPRVDLVPCSRSGKVDPGAASVPARAEIVDDRARYASLSAPLQKKYGLLYRLFMLADRLPGRRRTQGGGRVYLVLRPTG